MTPKEALQNIKEVDTGGEITAPKYKGDVVLEEEIQVLEQLVERDTPKSTIKKTKVIYTQHECPICVCRLDMIPLEEVNFCPKCGQRLDWSK
jgi:hypothetical protein